MNIEPAGVGRERKAGMVGGNKKVLWGKVRDAI